MAGDRRLPVIQVPTRTVGRGGLRLACGPGGGSRGIRVFGSVTAAKGDPKGEEKGDPKGEERRVTRRGKREG